MKFLKKVLNIILIGAICFGICACGTDDVADQVANVVQAENENVLAVKGGTNNNYPDVTYEQAFDAFFGMPTWKYFEGTQEGPDDDGDGKPDYTIDNIDVVEFTGTCTYMDVEVKALIQFTLDKEEGSFEATYLSFNEVPQSTIILAGLISKVFESYMEENGITPNEAETTENAEIMGNNEDSLNDEPEMNSAPQEESRPEEEQEAVENTETLDVTYFEDVGMRSTTVEFTYWDEGNEITMSLTYLGETSDGQYVGDVYSTLSEYNDSTGEYESISVTGTFVENTDESGIITLDNGNAAEYQLEWQEDHYIMNLYLDGEEVNLLEAEWAYSNVG